MSDKKYIGSGKKAANYDLVNCSIELSSPHVKENVFEYKGKKYLKITVAAKREIDQYGKSHTVYIDEFKPEQTEKDDLPF